MLVVDNLNSTDIIVSYTVVPRWFDYVVHSIDDKKLSISKSLKDNDKLDRELTNLSTNFGKTSATLVSQGSVMFATSVLLAKAQCCWLYQCCLLRLTDVCYIIYIMSWYILFLISFVYEIICPFTFCPEIICLR